MTEGIRRIEESFEQRCIAKRWAIPGMSMWEIGMTEWPYEHGVLALADPMLEASCRLTDGRVLDPYRSPCDISSIQVLTSVWKL